MIAKGGARNVSIYIHQSSPKVANHKSLESFSGQKYVHWFYQSLLKVEIFRFKDQNTKLYINSNL